MADRPHVTCIMTSSIDGRLHPSCYTTSPDGDVDDWDAVYNRIHDDLGADAWLIGRVTMAEMAKREAHSDAAAASPPRPLHRATGAHAPYAIAPDSHGRLHFGAPDIGGDAVIVLLGCDVTDDHLAELVAAGVSYIVASEERPDLPAMLSRLADDFGIHRLALEGGGGINGAMLDAGLVDELAILVVPAVDGSDTRQGIVIAPDGGLRGKVELSFAAAEPLDHGTVLLRYHVSRAAG